MAQAALVALAGSTVMFAPFAPAGIKRDELLELLELLINSRARLARLGNDLKTVGVAQPDEIVPVSRNLATCLSSAS